MKRDELRLVPDLVPSPLWRVSAHRLLSRSDWKTIRLHTLAQAADACTTCRAVIPGGRFMVCDEVWSYGEEVGEATLSGFRMLCPDCDKAKHFGLASQIGVAEVALKQLASVNGLSPEAARALQGEAYAEWVRRSRLRWHVDVAPTLLQQWPALRVLVGKTGEDE